MARGLDEEQAAVDAGILDVALPLSRELLPQVGGVLILDVLDDGVPAGSTVSWVVREFQCENNAYHRSLLTWSPYPGVSTMFSLRRTPFSSMTRYSVRPITLFWFPSVHTMRHGLDLGGGANGLIGGQAALGINEVGGEDGVDESGLAQTCLACWEEETGEF